MPIHWAVDAEDIRPALVRELPVAVVGRMRVEDQTARSRPGRLASNPQEHSLDVRDEVVRVPPLRRAPTAENRSGRTRSRRRPLPSRLAPRSAWSHRSHSIGQNICSPLSMGLSCPPSARSSVDRARASGARGRRFESCRARTGSRGPGPRAAGVQRPGRTSGCSRYHSIVRASPPRGRPPAPSRTPRAASSGRRTGGRSRPSGLPLPRMSGSTPGAGELGDQRDHLADPVRAPAAGVERLAAHVVAVEARRRSPGRRRRRPRRRGSRARASRRSAAPAPGRRARR